MATTTPTPRSSSKKPLTARQKAWRSSVALKALMAVTGLIMVLFLLAHMYGNLMAFGGEEIFNTYASHLRTLGEPILPYEGFFWALRIVLLAALAGHVYSAIRLSHRDAKARSGAGRRYQSSKGRRGLQRSYSSFTLRWGGVVIFLYVIFHILNLTTNHIHPGGASPSPFDRLVNTFNVWPMVLLYTVAVLTVGFHVRHGVWSALTTLGANTSALVRRRLNLLAYAVAGAITIGFLLVPWSIAVGLISA